MVTGVASIADEWALLELGFRCLWAEDEEEREGGVLGFSSGGAEASYRLRGRRRSSQASRRWRWIERLAAFHRAASQLEEDDLLPDLFGETVPGWLADIGPSWMGFGLVHTSSLFFSSSISFLFVSFSGFNSSVWIQSYMQDFEFELLMKQVYMFSNIMYCSNITFMCIIT
jgi:hypothetical protein